MNIITLLTKRSVREADKERKFLKFYSSLSFTPGDMIEVIDGNKKNPAIILKSEPAQAFKEEIRSGELTLTKLKLSKSGPCKNGAVFDRFTIADIKSFLKDPSAAKNSPNPNISSFFPRSYKKSSLASPGRPKKKSHRESEASGISDILSKNINHILNKEKTYNNPMQERVDTIRKYFYENARYGYGSFSYYIGMFKQVPEREIDQIFAEVQQTKKSVFDKKKLFWFRIGKYIKQKNNSEPKDR